MNSGNERGIVLPAGTSAMGLAALLTSLAILFLGSLAGFWIIRARAVIWSENLPGLPTILWASTGLLLLLSHGSQRAAELAKKEGVPSAVPALQRGLYFALVFSGFQALAWADLSQRGLPVDSGSLYAFNFYFLTGLHAVHVLGGLVYARMILTKSKRGEASAEQVSNVAVYWHFLGAVWAVLFFTLLLANASFTTPRGIYLGFLFGAAVFGLMFIGYWTKTLVQLARHQLWSLFLLSLFPPMAYAFACTRGREIGLHKIPLPWIAVFALLVFSISIALATGLNLGELRV